MRVTIFSALALGAVSLLGCGAATDGEPGKSSGGAGGAPGGGTGSGDLFTGSQSSGGDEGLGGNFGGSSGSGTGDGCVGVTTTAELVPLDLYLLLDASGSMVEKTGASGQGVSKWDAVTNALQAFFQDPKSAGLGVGLQYFPVRDPAAPASCTSSNQCGAFGPCLLKVCNNQPGLFACNTNFDCGFNGQCITLGQCAGDPALSCYPTGSTCGGGAGQCVAIQSSFCVKQDSCDAGDYAAPDVEIDVLGGAAAGLIASMNAREPSGATPRAPALQGAIDHAKAWAAAPPTHKVVALSAPDGMPTECSPLEIGGIASIAASGASGSPEVPTFVVGVFGGNQPTAKANLDEIAAAGGTGQAFFIDAQGDVQQAFVDALNAIRGTSLACEYQIPPPPRGEKLDYGHVNVEHVPPGSSTPETVLYVGSAAGCDPVKGGWYYDEDPDAGGSPTKIEMCPATCDAFVTGGSVGINVGCETRVPR